MTKEQQSSLAAFFYDTAKIVFAGGALAGALRGAIFAAVIGLIVAAANVILGYTIQKEDVNNG